MAQRTIQFSVVVRPKDPRHGCEHYIHASFYPEPEDAMADALAAWAVDEPHTDGEVVFIAPGLGWDPRMGAERGDGVLLAGHGLFLSGLGLER